VPERRHRLFVLDATAVLFRAWHAAPSMIGQDGSDVRALSGFGRWLCRLLSHARPTHLAAVFDADGPSFRHALHPGYKANRDPPPPDLAPQLARAPDLAEAAGLLAFRQPGFEADDLMATLARRGVAAGLDVILVSPDKDVLQLVDDRVVAMDPKSFELIDADAVRRRFGVAPRQLVDLLALAGDPSDNVPGVPGVGPKTAASLLAAVGSLDALYDDLERVGTLPIRGAARLGERLAGHREQAELSRRLVRLDPEVPLGVRPLTLGAFRWRGPRGEGHPFWQWEGLLSLRRRLVSLGPRPGI
jgi:DNA polymerase-1